MANVYEQNVINWAKAVVRSDKKLQRAIATCKAPEKLLIRVTRNMAELERSIEKLERQERKGALS